MAHRHARTAAVTGWKLVVAFFAIIGAGLTVWFYGTALNWPEWSANLLLGLLFLGIIVTLFKRPRRLLDRLVPA